MGAGVIVRGEVLPFLEVLKRLGYEPRALAGPVVGEPPDRHYLVLSFANDRARQVAAFRIGHAAAEFGVDMQPIGRCWDIEYGERCLLFWSGLWGTPR